MNKVKEIVITGVVTSLLAGIGYMVKDYIHLKEKDIIKKETEILKNAYSKLDSLHKAEIVEREKYKMYIKSLVDSVLTVSKANKNATKEAIVLLEDNNYKLEQNERDSLYIVLNAYTMGARSNNSK